MNFDTKKFHGITVALYSCFTADDKVDASALKALTRFYIEKGIKSLYVCGSTGEGLLMSVPERKETLEAVMSEASGKMNIIVHIGAAATRDACELAAHAEKSGADAVSAIPSVYYHLSEHAIENSWATIMGASSLPFIIYNIPQLTGYNMTKQLFDKMKTYSKVIGIKNSAETVYQTMQFKQWGGPGFIVFHGMDEQYAAGRMMGADGGIGGTYGVMPELFLRMENFIAAGDIEKAKNLQNTINSIIEDLCSFPSMYGATKEIMRCRGVPIGQPRLPFEPVPQADMPRIDALYRKIMKAVEQG